MIEKKKSDRIPSEVIKTLTIVSQMHNQVTETPDTIAYSTIMILLRQKRDIAPLA